MSALSDFQSPGEHFPVGTLLSSLADASQLPPGWVAFDGSLLPRAEYPAAAELFGDIRMCDATESIRSLPALVDWVHSGSLSGVARESFVLVAHAAYCPSPKGHVFVRRSTNAGGSFDVVTLSVSNVSSFSVELHWLGGLRVLAIFWLSGAGDSAKRWYAACSSDMGGTWTPLVQLVGAFSDASSDRSVATDTRVAVDGGGHAYIALRAASGSGCSVFAIQVGTGQVVSFSSADSGLTLCVIAGRSMPDGSGELMYMRRTGSGVYTLHLAVINAQTSVVQQGTSVTPDVAWYAGDVAGRFWSVQGSGDNKVVVATPSGKVYRLQLAMLLPPTLVFAGFPTDTGRRLLDNIMTTVDGIGYDVATGARVGRAGIAAATHFNLSNGTYTAASAWDVRPVRGRFLAKAPNLSLCMRSARVIGGFFSGIGAVAGYAPGAAELSEAVGWYNVDTGVYSAAKLSVDGLLIWTYMPKDDYGQYLQLPYMPGIICRAK